MHHLKWLQESLIMASLEIFGLWGLFSMGWCVAPYPSKKRLQSNFIKR